MGRRANQFTLLLWKNYVLQKRRMIWTVIEIAMPVVFAVILIAIRTKVAYTVHPNATEYQDFSIRHLPSNLKPTPYEHQWEIAYSPNNPVLKELMRDVMKSLEGSFVSIDNATGFENEEELLQYAANKSMEVNATFLGGIVFVDNFDNKNVLPKNITYSIRLKASQVNVPISDETSGNSNISRWKTNMLYPLVQVPGPREPDDKHGGEPGYWREGFLSLQNAIDKSILKVSSVVTNNISVNMQRFPYPPYNDDLFILVIQSQLPVLLLISYILNALDITRSIVQEKEKKLKESMKMMGLNNWLHWSAWLTKCFLFLAISTFFMTILFWVKVGDKGSVISNSDPTVIFVFFLAFALATISLSFTVSVFFSKANTAAVVAGVVWFFTYIPYMFLINRYSSLSRASKFGACLLSNTAMAFGAFIIGLFEGTGEGVQWSNIARPISTDDNFTFLDVIVMLLVDAVLYGVITWYIEAVFPGEFGIPKKWYFPFMKSYWFGTQVTNKPQQEDYENTRDSEYFEKDPVDSVAGIQIKKLKKVFKGKKVAVNAISLNVFEGQITALLGHNGAGKTTTMSMLTGLFPPSDGTAVVNGYDICEDIDGVRSSLGLCPQHDVLFDDLTVEEHLYFFAKLKNCPKGLVKAEVDKYISSLRLEDKRHVRSKALSGGMKRKLSVGIALISDSKIIILDEPTSGMDPAARRFTWDILQQHRAGRTILLTTHHMDEADLLGDRIAIMAEGELQCCGSSLFLKNRYGVGYHMTISKAENCNVAEIKNMIYSSIKDSELENNIGNELTFILPNDQVTHFEGLFNTMEKRREELGIRSYGVSVTTMEEVFLKVGNQSRFTENDDSSGYRSNASSISSEESLSVERSHVQSHAHDETTPLLSTSDPEVGFVTHAFRNSGIYLYIQQFYGMFVKRIIHTRRNLLVTLAQLLIPLVFTAFALLAVNSFPPPSDLPALTLKPATYGATKVLYCHDVHSERYSQYSKAFAEQFNGTITKTENLNKENDTCDMEDVIIRKSNKNMVTFNNEYLIAAVFKNNTDDNRLNGIAFFNNQPWHTPAIALNAYSNALLKASLNSSYSLMTINHPLPRSVSERADDEINGGFTTGFAIAFDMVFGMSILASTFVVFLIKERATKAKHIQFVSGVHITNFWFSTFLWDLINYMITCLLILIVFFAFDVEAYTEDGRIAYVLLLLFLYGWGIIPLMYLFSFVFKTPSVGFVRMTILNILLGTTAFLAVEILEIPELNLMTVANTLHWIFLFSPSFCLAKAMNDMYMNYQFLKICKSSPEAEFFCKYSDNPSIRYVDNYLDWETPGIGRDLVFLAIAGVIYFAWVLLIEFGAFRSLRYMIFGKCCNPKIQAPTEPEPMVEEDEDVLKEQDRILYTTVDDLFKTDALIIKELRKVYPKKGGKDVVVAVDNMCLGVPHGECFGLLGINGAGKTTTFNMLTGDVPLTAGDAFIEKFSVKYNIQRVQQNIGYCPQFDALIDEMTGRETLFMYARLRGVKEAMIPKEVEKLLSLFSLNVHADKQTKAYSGGNKRKLNTAIALIGDPPVVFLDEPSTGMDPGTRRLLWDSICQIRASGRSIILTSHSMEECEALCTRLAIMVNGKFKCLGSIQHLKSRFGKGYTLLAKVAPDGSGQNLCQLKVFIEEKFPDSKLKDEHEGLVHYHIRSSDLSWASVFGTMEKAKAVYNIEDYSVSQTTLEQVFLNFARNQRDEDD
ncbi:ATP-binding cassette sub-family A member 3-like [Anneissia japonica]|uniref:ATP-binding cassette sub-family A member 3-like n=1 Tax=Anneissia japonica TaxID=1529436 RepID=UPI001425AD09|nr:ATP-binding cassette sub-family A member 3-like [Anneissia japonica]XP_033097471.1 ATP-binding cassette sub-family A member 3-like [Anneissia japonica]